MANDVIAERARIGWNRRNSENRDIIVVSNATGNPDKGKILIESFEAANLPAFQLSRFRGTADAPADVQNNDALGELAFNGYSGTGSFQKASIGSAVDAAVVAGQSPASRMVFKTGLNNVAERLVGYFSSEGYLGLGTAFDPSVAATRAAFDVHAAKLDTVGRLQARFDSYGTSADGPYVAVGHARGTFVAPANNVAGDNLGDFEFYAYAGGWLQSAEIRAFVTGAVANGVTPDTNMTFKVATGGAMSTRMQLFSTGRIGMGSGSRATEADAAANGGGALWVAENANRAPIAMQYSGTDVNSVQLLGRKSRGASMSAPTNVVFGDSICEFRSQSYSGGWQSGGYLEFAVDAAVVNGQAPATRFGISVNPNNAIAVQAFRINSDKKFICGDSMTAYTEADFNLVCVAGVDRIHTLFAQNSGGGQNFKLNFATYTTGYTNGAPASINVIDSNFSCSFRFDHKLTGASSNSQAPSLRLDSAANMPNAAFFIATGSYGGGQGVIFIGNRNTAPSSNPVGGGLLSVNAGALVWRGSAGTVTTIANA
jgi:hypothetical protein